MVLGPPVTMHISPDNLLVTNSAHLSQELAPHTSPIFVSAFRLLPAGVALVAWAAASGRQQPKGWQAWLACALFGLVDGTAFQVRGFLSIYQNQVSRGSRLLYLLFVCNLGQVLQWLCSGCDVVHVKTVPSSCAIINHHSICICHLAAIS